MVELVLVELIAVPAEQSRGRHNPRAVKRKMSTFPTKARAAPAPRQTFPYAERIRVVAPPGTPARQAGSSPSAPPEPVTKPVRRQAPGASAQSRPRRPWLEHVHAWQESGLTRTVYCARHDLSPRAFHRWVTLARRSSRRKAHRPEPAGPCAPASPALTPEGSPHSVRP